MISGMRTIVVAKEEVMRMTAKPWLKIVAQLNYMMRHPRCICDEESFYKGGSHVCKSQEPGVYHTDFTQERSDAAV